MSPSSSPAQSASPSSESKCPVNHTLSSSSSSPSPWSKWFKKSSSPNPSSSTAQVSGNNISSCPVQHQQHSPASIEAAANHAQTPHPDQNIPLSTHRTISSIPRGAEGIITSTTATTNSSTTTNNNENPAGPNHQPQNESNWVYPSEQQFFNAMKRKGWDVAPGTEATIPFVVQIHNAVNERGWNEIQKWENLRANTNPKLVKFIGRPKDKSPRALFYSSLWLRNEPFDRHDWYVSRDDGSDSRRYVIDFYNGQEEKGTSSNGTNPAAAAGLPRMYLDVRPALDDSNAAIDRMKMFMKDAFPGFSQYMFKP
mmetsp:Transcript_18894/g.21888  ORF Transcript_18894/g.21888 Transcript_18894/m.21888 type:complete len:311 (-) Transcript_18894:101-1033(-)